MKKNKPKILTMIGGDKLVLIAAIVLVFVLFTTLNRNFFSWAIKTGKFSQNTF